MDDRKSSPDHHEQYLLESKQRSDSLHGLSGSSKQSSMSPSKKPQRIKFINSTHGGHHGSVAQDFSSNDEEDNNFVLCYHNSHNEEEEKQNRSSTAGKQEQDQHHHGIYKNGALIIFRANIHPSTTTKTSIIDNSNNTNSCSKKIRCPVFGRKFPSKKSLCGHMRCHPNREWRGIQPPPSPSPSPSLSPPVATAPNIVTTSISSTSTSTLLLDKDYSCANFISTWSVTAKRGIRNKAATVTPPRTSTSTSEEEQEHFPDADAMAAAYTLIDLNGLPAVPAMEDHDHEALKSVSYSQALKNNTWSLADDAAPYTLMMLAHHRKRIEDDKEQMS